MSGHQHPGFFYLRRGMDPWGSAFFYEAQVLGQSSNRAAFQVQIYQVTIRSFGPNERDDRGGRDDLQESWHQDMPVPASQDSGK